MLRPLPEDKIEGKINKYMKPLFFLIIFICTSVPPRVEQSIKSPRCQAVDMFNIHSLISKLTPVVTGQSSTYSN